MSRLPLTWPLPISGEGQAEEGGSVSWGPAMPLDSATLCKDLPWRNAGRAILGLLLGLAIGWSFWGTIGNPACQDLDFGAYYRAALAVQHGETPYTVDEHGPLGVYPYAPAFAYAFIPLTFLEYPWACRCWLLMNWLATIAGIVLALKLLSSPDSLHISSGDIRVRGSADGDRDAVWGIVLLALLPTCAYLWANLRVGQVAMFMVLGCLAWAYCQQRGYRLLGGMLLAAASALKLAPLALVPYLVVQRDRRGLAGLMLGGVLLFAAPAAWVGWEGSCHLHAAWIQHTADTQVPVQIYRPGNQSLLAELARLPPFSNGHQCYSPERLTQLAHSYPLLLAGALAVLYVWILWERWRRQGSHQTPANSSCDLLHLALLLIFLTLANPRAWRCNFVALLFPCLMLAQHAWLRRPGYRIGLAALAVVLLACAMPTHGIAEQGWSVAGWLLLGKHFWGGVAVAGACWWTARGSLASAVS